MKIFHEEEIVTEGKDVISLKKWLLRWKGLGNVGVYLEGLEDQMKAKHKSLEKELARHIKWIENLKGVNKVVLGLSESCRHKYSPGYIKIKNEVPGGIRINGYTGNGVMNIFIRTATSVDQKKITETITKKFSV